MLVLLIVSIGIAVVARPMVRAFAEFGAAIAVWNLVIGVPGKVSRRLEPPIRYWLTLGLAFALPALLSIYLLQYATDFAPWVSLQYFADWYALIPLGIVVLLSYAAGERMIDREHPVTGLLIIACLLFVPMYLGLHGVTLGSDEDGAPNEPTNPVVLKAMRRAGYHFTIYWLYIVVGYAAMIAGSVKGVRGVTPPTA